MKGKKQNKKPFIKNCLHPHLRRQHSHKNKTRKKKKKKQERKTQAEKKIPRKEKMAETKI